MFRRSDGSIITKRDRIKYVRLQQQVLNFPENTQEQREEIEQRLREHFAKYGDEGTDLSPHSSDSSEVSSSMSAASEDRNVREENDQGEVEVFDAGSTLPWWITSTRENRYPFMPAPPLSDYDLFLVANTPTSAALDPYMENFRGLDDKKSQEDPEANQSRSFRVIDVTNNNTKSKYY